MKYIADSNEWKRGLGEAAAVLDAALADLSDLIGLGGTADAPAVETPLAVVERICRRFHAVATQLRTRHDNRPPFHIADEYDVQDLLRALLRGRFDDVRPEEYTPSYAGSSSRMDFLLKAERIVVEVKKTRGSLRDRQVGDELITDISHYSAHQDCGALVCFVYDPDGLISNPTGLERDLGRAEPAPAVVVVVAPRA